MQRIECDILNISERQMAQGPIRDNDFEPTSYVRTLIVRVKWVVVTSSAELIFNLSEDEFRSGR